MLSLKRNLKRSKLFEIQKITKRARLLEKRSGTEAQLQKNERKRSRLLEELELLKDINLNALAKEITEDGGLLHSALHGSPPADLQERARWRLLSSKAMQQPLLSRKERGEVINSGSVTSAVGSASQRRIDPQNSEGGSSQDGSKTFQIHVRVASGGSDESSADEQFPSLQDGRSQKGRSGQEGATVVCKSVSASSSIGDHTDEVGGSHRASNSVLGAESLFVDSLGGKPSKKAPKVTQKKKTNRLGQRARRKEWEQVYGRTAKHAKVAGKANSSKHADKTRGVQGRRSVAVAELQKSPRTTAPAAGERMLHPSWAASRRRKEQEASVLQFLGQKTVFSDSDID